jgi:hypothetical protein
MTPASTSILKGSRASPIQMQTTGKSLICCYRDVLTERATIKEKYEVVQKTTCISTSAYACFFSVQGKI